MPKGGGRGRPKARPQIESRDGFVWTGEGEYARLYHYLYNVVPQGLRRQQMMRYMLLGFMAERGIRPGKGVFIPPVPAETIEITHPGSNDDRDTVVRHDGDVAATPAHEVERELTVVVDRQRSAGSTSPVRSSEVGVGSLKVEPAISSEKPAAPRPAGMKPGMFAGFKG